MPVHQITTCTVYHSVTLLLQARNFIFSTNLFHHRLDSWYPSATLLQPVLICLPVFRSSSIFRFFLCSFLVTCCNTLKILSARWYSSSHRIIRTLWKHRCKTSPTVHILLSSGYGPPEWPWNALLCHLWPSCLEWNAGPLGSLDLTVSELVKFWKLRCFRLLVVWSPSTPLC